MDSSDEKSGKEWFAVVQDFLYENLLADSELESEHKGVHTNGTQWVREKGRGVRRHVAGQSGPLRRRLRISNTALAKFRGTLAAEDRPRARSERQRQP